MELLLQQTQRNYWEQLFYSKNNCFIYSGLFWQNEKINRVIASLIVPGRHEFNFPHSFLKFRSISLIFPQSFLNFFLILTKEALATPLKINLKTVFFVPWNVRFLLRNKKGQTLSIPDHFHNYITSNCSPKCNGCTQLFEPML